MQHVYRVFSNHATRAEIIESVRDLGSVTDLYSDGTFAFQCSGRESDREFWGAIGGWNVICEQID